MKQFCTINQQVNILKSRGMKFKSIKFAKEVLNNVNYYNIINAFKVLFVIEDSKEEKYIDNLFFEEVYEVFLFDRDLRHLFLKYILLLEDTLRTNVAHVFASEEGPYQYLDDKAFNPNVNSQYITDMIEKINSIIEKTYKDSRDDMVSHFKSMNEPLPIWVLVNTFDFNLIKTFYLNMKYAQKQMITNKYSITIKEYKSFLQTLNMYRNVCAHDYRLLFYRIHDFNKRIVDTDIHRKLNITKDNNEYHLGKSDLFSVVIIFKYLLSKEVFKEFYNSLVLMFHNLKNKLKL